MHKLNPNVLKAEYAVRGLLSLRAEELRCRLLAGDAALPFSRVISCNIGNPQQLRQPPITFVRAVLSLIELLPDDTDGSNAPQRLGSDVIERARRILQHVGGSTGAYSHSKGALGIRQEVARFLSERDGHVADAEAVFLTNGASEGISRVLTLFANGPNVGVMIPVPQYPLYAATIALLNATAVPYYLHEDEQWALTAKDLEDAYTAAPVKPSILCVINPGNPTGSCLSPADVAMVLDFAAERDLIVLSDEVYQENWYCDGFPFTSARSVYLSNPDRYGALHLFSFHSCSKGLLGECGKRGGFVHYEGDSVQVLEQLYKLASISLCPNLQGQALVSLMVNPPRPGDESFEQYERETKAIFESLKRRASKLAAAFNSMLHVTCQPARGAMYLFPRFDFPEGVLEAAKAAGQEPDVFYALKLLDGTGVCMVPGSGFGQAPGTFHVRSTFLPSEADMDDLIQRMTAFHREFMILYGGDGGANHEC